MYLMTTVKGKATKGTTAGSLAGLSALL